MSGRRLGLFVVGNIIVEAGPCVSSRAYFNFSSQGREVV